MTRWRPLKIDDFAGEAPKKERLKKFTSKHVGVLLFLQEQPYKLMCKCSSKVIKIAESDRHAIANFIRHCNTICMKEAVVQVEAPQVEAPQTEAPPPPKRLLSTEELYEQSQVAVAELQEKVKQLQLK